MGGYTIHNLIYLHGFASSPASTKANKIAQFFKNKGINIYIPDLNCGDFTNVTLSKMLEKVNQEIELIDGKFIMIGSSMGGYLSALYVERNTRLPERLLMLAPGFDLSTLFSKWLGEYGINKWKKEGFLSFFHYSYNREIPLLYKFYEDLMRYNPYPYIKGLRAHIIHGMRDDIVPLNVSKEFQKINPQTTVEIVDDTHELSNSIEIILEQIDGLLK